MVNSKMFVVVTDPIYFDTLKAEEGGKIKLDARGTQSVFDTCKKGDIAVVWLQDSNFPLAYFNIIKVTNRPDLIGQVEEFDEKKDRPHQVRLDVDDSVIRMDLRRDTYKVLSLKNRPISEKTLSAPITKPLNVKICWTVYKYTISGENLHFVEEIQSPKFKYTLPESGFELLEGRIKQTFIKALGLDTKSPSKRKLDYIAGDDSDDEEQTPKKRKSTPKNSPTTTTRSSPRTSTPPPKSSSSPSSKKSSPSPAKSTPPTSPYLSPRVSKPTNHYTPQPHIPKPRSPSPVAKSKTTKKVQFEQGTKPPTSVNPNPGRRASKRTGVAPTSPTTAAATERAAAALPVTLSQGSVLAIRADVGKDFVVARVSKTTTIAAPAQATVAAMRTVERTAIPVTWLVEAHEGILRGCYAAPEWHASVSWGAVVKTNVKMRYDKEKDMYWLTDKTQDILALV